MSSTLQAPSSREPEASGHTPAGPVEPWTIHGFVRRHPWWTTGVGVVVLSTALVLWAGTRPSYDAYGWLVWGYQTLHLALDLGGAPSWKPLPYLFTVPFAVFGHYQLYLWMVTCVALSLAGSIFAGRIAYRLVGGEARDRRWPAMVAAVFAGAAVLGLEDYMHYILSVQSDPMIVTFTLAAVDMHLSGHRRWAFVFGTLASLGRPEAWPFLGLYSIWSWRTVPSMRWLMVGGWALIVFMWFGIPTITNGRPFVAGQLALESPRAPQAEQDHRHDRPLHGVALLADLGRRRVHRRGRRAPPQLDVLVLAAGSVLWVVVEIAFALHGWPALPRYVMEPAAIAGVFAGVAVGWLLIEVPRLRVGLPRWAGIPVVLLLVLVLVPGAIARIRTERRDLSHERDRTTEIDGCGDITVLGGTDTSEPAAIRWQRRVRQRDGLVHAAQCRLRRPPAEFRAPPEVPDRAVRTAHKRLAVAPWHTRRSQLVRCAGLHAKYVFTGRHPGGVRVRLRTVVETP